MTTADVLAIIGVGGMGVAVARRMGAGRAIVLGDVNTAQVEGVASQLTDDGHHVVTGHVDVTSRDSVTEFARLATSSGRVSSVVHTAGLSPQQASVEVVLAVDLLGVALTLEVFGEVIAPGGAGVVISSMAGHFQPPIPQDVERQLASVPADELLGLPACGPAAITSSEAAYPFAKRANQLRVAAAASPWGLRRARINSISPGVIATAMGRRELAGPSGDSMRAMVNASGVRRFGTPDDIAAAAEFLLSPAAGFITGADLLVDGGVVAAVRTGTLDLAAAAG
jgi:meso-butanediol dehydrogenase / (S,S)-butanediol dehydrogenase / diacetyl reductase